MRVSGTRTGISFTVSAAQHKQLEAVVSGGNTPQRHAWRARIILLSANGLGTHAIVAATDKSKTTVWRWQERFAEAGVEGLLSDKTRPAGKAPTAPERVAEVVRLTHTPPPHKATHRTARAMARAVGLGVVTVERIWPSTG